MTPRTKVVILGGGIMGLTAAEELSRRGEGEILVIEREQETGGICRGAKVREQTFDFGPHAFSMRFQSSFEYCRKVCGDDLLDLGPKRVSIVFRGEEYPFPLRIGPTLSKLAPSESLACLIDFVAAYVRQHLIRPVCLSYEEHIKSYFGTRLYEIFFRDYTRKVWGVEPSTLAASFAAERIPRISIRKMTRDSFRKQVLRRTPTSSGSKYDPSRLYYPKYGFRGFIEKLEEVVLGQGVRIEKAATVVGIDTEGRRARAVCYLVDGTERRVECDSVISSLPIDTLVGVLEPASAAVPELGARLKFRPLTLVLLVLRVPRVYDAHWVYYQDDSIYMHRVYETKAFGPGVSPREEETGLCAEVTNRDNLGEAELVRRVTGDFVRLGVFKAEDVITTKVVNVEHGYPLYDIGYRERLTELLRRVGKYENVISCGRQGLFVYIDTDHCMKMAAIIADHLLEDKGLDPLYAVAPA